MTPWECGIGHCGDTFRSAEDLVLHQISDHTSCHCKVCGEEVPAGFIAIRHAFQEHRRAEYVRAYNADPDDIRLRERVTELVEEQVDVERLLTKIESDGEAIASLSD